MRAILIATVILLISIVAVIFHQQNIGFKDDQIKQQENLIEPLDLQADIKKDPEFSKVDRSIQINYLGHEDAAKLQRFLSNLKKGNPLISYKISSGPVKYYSPRQLKATRTK